MAINTTREILENVNKIPNIVSQLAEKAGKTETIKTAAGKPAVVYVGVIRNTGGGWFFIEDANHEKLNFTTLSINTNKEIQVDMKPGTKVGSLIAVPDETFTGLGLVCGTSVGVYNSAIRCYADFSGKIDGNGVITTKDWFNGTYSIVKSADGSQITVDFDGVDDINMPFSTVPEYEGVAEFDGMEIRAYRVALNQVIFRAYRDLYGYIAFNGTDWVASSSCIANISASFANNELTITHDGMTSTGGFLAFNSVNIQMRDSLSGGLIHARVTNVTTNTIKIKFYDTSGNIVTAPNTNMRLWFNRPGFKVPHVWPQLAKAYFNIGRTIIRPDKISSASGNIWLIGINHA